VPLALIFAMPMELGPLVKSLGLQPSTVRGVQLRTGRIGARDVVATVAGMGTAAAAAGTARLLDVTDDEQSSMSSCARSPAQSTPRPIGTLVVGALRRQRPGGRRRRRPRGVRHGKP